MKKTVEQVKALWCSRAYALIVGFTALGAYGFTVTHHSIGMDDTAVPLYFEDGLAPYVGRWTLFVINRILHISIGSFAPWLTEMLSVLILMLSVTLWCVLWKKICEPAVKVPDWGYAFVAGLFLSCPLISEVFVFCLHNGVCMGYGVTALALLYLLESLRYRVEMKEAARGTVFSSLLLCAAIGFYESFSVVYIMGAVMLFFLNRFLYGKKAGESKYQNSFLPWAGKGLLILGMALLERIAILRTLKAVYHLDALSAYNVQYRNFFGDIFTTENELQMVLKRFFMKYYVNALVYLPITVLFLSLLGIGICAICFCIRKKDAFFILCFSAILLLPVFMSLLEGLATRYRSAQYVPVVCAFAVLLFFVLLYQKKTNRVLRIIYGVLLGILLYNQAGDMNKWFYIDYLKYQDMAKVMDHIAYGLKKEFDTSKPIVFRGAYKVPYEIAKSAYVDFDSWQFKVIAYLTDLVDVHLKEKYYAEDAAAYVFAEMPLVSALQWGVTAFDGTSQQLINFWKMQGTDGLYCVADVAVIEEAERIREEENMPGYPEAGYIRDCGSFIIVNMSR